MRATPLLVISAALLGPALIVAFGACGSTSEEVSLSATATPVGTPAATATPATQSTATPAPVAAVTATPGPVPADWATFTDADGRLNLRYPTEWVLDVVPATPPANSPGYSIASLFKFRWAGKEFPASAMKVDIEVSVPALGGNDCRSEPEGAAAAQLGGAQGWKQKKELPDFNATGIFLTAYVDGRCYTLAGYFGTAATDQETFRRIAQSVTFNSPLQQ